MTEQRIIVEARLRTDQAFLEMCVLKLYEKQTEDEQSFRSTTHTNRVGFTKANALFFTDAAEYIREHDHIPYKDVKNTAKRMVKYSEQLLNYLTHEELEL